MEIGNKSVDLIVEQLDRITELLTAISKPIEPEQRQMDIKQFCKHFGVPDGTVRDWIDSDKKFPAFKLGKRWYVDIPGFKKWRIKKHIECYKYA